MHVTYRVRIWTPLDSPLTATPGATPWHPAAEAVDGQEGLAATVEADGGGGAVVALAAGIDGGGATAFIPAHSGQGWDPDNYVLRLWKLEETGELTGPADYPLGPLGEMRQALFENEVEGIRLLTAEGTGDDGNPVIYEASWYDHLDEQMSASEDEWDLEDADE